MTSFPAPLEKLIAYVRSLRPDAGPLGHLSDAVATAQELSDQADALIGYFVDQARGSGASWSQIGAAMGVTKQAAQKRFAAGDEPLLPEGKAFFGSARGDVGLRLRLRVQPLPSPPRR